jgi:hypothetical protein
LLFMVWFWCYIQEIAAKSNAIYLFQLFPSKNLKILQFL